MARRSTVTIGYVNLWGARIGIIAWDPEASVAAFEYDKSFQSSGVELSPMMMPLSDQVYRFSSLGRDTFKGLPGMLADSLPDKFGNALIDQWLAETGRTPSDFNPVERLLYVGNRGMGALEFEPQVNNKSTESIPLNIQEMVELCSRILTEKKGQRFQLDSHDEARSNEGLSQILAVGTSAGGARAKAIIAWNEQTGDVRSGQINAGEGYTYWLLKFDGVSENRDKELADPKGYGRIEYAYHLMAVDAGIEMTRCRLFEEGGRAHFMTQRFDRLDGGSKLHMQSLCALGHHDFNIAGATSYEQAFQICDLLGLGMSAKEQMFLRMVFNVVGMNRDDHTKQIAFLMNKQGQWQLSPAYDMTYAYNPVGEWTSTHQMSINRKRSDITYQDLMGVGSRQGMNKGHCKKLVDKINEVFSQWPDYARKAGMDENHKLSIEQSISPVVI
jgi:serine/threonine-protein kinase HipA